MKGINNVQEYGIEKLCDGPISITKTSSSKVWQISGYRNAAQNTRRDKKNKSNPYIDKHWSKAIQCA
jgi:hypothetical protein